MRTPVRIDIRAVREKKVGDLEMIVENGPCEHSVDSPLHIGAPNPLTKSE